jgi:hypothetical protein
LKQKKYKNRLKETQLRFPFLFFLDLAYQPYLNKSKTKRKKKEKKSGKTNVCLATQQ